MMLSGILFFYTDEVKASGENWWNSNWDYRKLITWNNAYITDSVIEEFVCVLNLSSDPELVLHAQDNGDDICFIDYDDNSTQLSHEIEYFNNGDGQLVVWMLDPNIQTKKVWMYYGNDGASNQEDVSGVWGNYTAVYHFRNLSDSAGTYDLTNVNSVTLNTSGGIFGGCADFGTADNKHLKQSALLDGGGDFTITMYLNPTTLGADGSNTDDYIINKLQDSSNYENLYIFYNDDQSDFRFRIKTGNGEYNDINDFENEGNINEWSYFVAKHSDNTKWEARVDDNSQELGTNAGTFNAGTQTDFFIGASTAGSKNYDGKIDELRVAYSEFSEAWIATEQNMMSNATNNSWFTLGDQEEAASEPTYSDPVISDENPTNSSLVHITVPQLSITVTDNDINNTINVTWQSNSTNGVDWVTFGTNTTTSNSETVYQTNSNFSEALTTYYWRVNISDGYNRWDNETFYFSIALFSNNNSILSNIVEGNSADIYAIDFDKDGDTDVIDGSPRGEYDGGQGFYAWSENLNGDGTSWEHHYIDNDMMGCIHADVTDLDGDGDYDIVGTSRDTVLGSGEGVIYFENDGDNENFTQYVVHLDVSGDVYPYVAWFADIDGQNMSDIVVVDPGQNDLYWMENGNSNNSWHYNLINASPDYHAIDVGDIDGDTYIDIVAGDGLDTVEWWENDGTGSFTQHDIDTSFSCPNKINLRDVDGDGDLDVITGNYDNPTPYGVFWIENDNGDGSSWTKHAIDDAITKGVRGSEAADVDYDGDIDIIVTYMNDNVVAWFENDGAESWTEHIIERNATMIPSDVQAIDVDMDGALDLVVASQDSETWGGTFWYENLGDFAPQLSGESPPNTTTDVSTTPQLHVVCKDSGGDSMTVEWWSNSSGAWAKFALDNTSVSSGTNVTQTNSNFSGNSQTYYWSVNVSDGSLWTNETYHFTTVASLNNLPKLTNPQGEPDNAVASYTTIYFNITWADADGESPQDGYLSVNISKDGWYYNQSLAEYYISGDNTTGAIYQYTTVLTAGEYSYTFYAYDGVGKNYSGVHTGLTVVAQSLSFTITTSSSGNLDFKDWTLSSTGVGQTTEYNVSEDNQTAVVPALNISNTGNVPLNFTMNWTGDPGTGISLKYNTTDNAPNHGVNEIAEDPSYTQIITNLATSTYEQLWLWLDFVSVEEQTNNQDVKITSSLYGG